MAQVVHGSGGIPRDGHAEEYATELWLDDPTASWLHPEGPLSETTPDEWQARREREEAERKAAIAQNPLADLTNAGLAASSYRLQLMLADAQRQLALSQGYYNPSDVMNARPGSIIRFLPF